MKKKYIIILAVLSVLLFTSCDFLFNYGKVYEPKFDAKVLWKIEIPTPSTYTKEIKSIDNNFYLLTEDFIIGNSGEINDFKIENVYLTVINKDSHKKINIKLNSGVGKYLMQDVKVNDTTYILLFREGSGKVFVYSTEDNLKKASIKLSSQDLSGMELMGLTPLSTVAGYEGKAIWYSRYSDAFVQLDIEKIDFSKAVDELQIIEPEILFNINNEYESRVKPVIKNNILYYVTCHPWEDDKCVIGAFNLKTKEQVWEVHPAISGYNYNSLLFCDDLLVYGDPTGFVVMNYKTGEILNFIKATPNGMLIVSSGDNFGLYYYKGLLYFTTGLHDSVDDYLGLPEGTSKALMCIDPKTLEYKWGDMPPINLGSLAFRPLVYGDKAYFATGFGLRVYHAKTGKLIGVDTSLCFFESINFIEGNTMYFLQGKGRKSYFVAIEAQ